MENETKLLRTVEIYKKDRWERIKFKELKIGDRFRLFDNGIVVMDNENCKEWLVSTLPCINSIGVYEVGIKEVIVMAEKEEKGGVRNNDNT